jgi:transcriptional regulator GlxA family with amidase domain
MPNIHILALPQCIASSITLPLEMLNAADAIARSQNRKAPALNIEIVSDQSMEVVTAGGLTIKASGKVDDIVETDLLIIPALWRNPEHSLKTHRQLIPWLKDVAASGSFICAVGTGSCFLAEASLLDHKPATTHWYYCDEFEQRYPKVQLKRQYLITEADNLYCAGSVNSVADLMIHIISLFYDPAISRMVEGQFSPEIRRPFESHAYAQDKTNIHRDETIINAQQWLRENISQSISFQDLASHFSLSSRSFNRRFKIATDVTPGEYLKNLRLDNAKELLRVTDLEINDIAALCGFQDASYFCSRFKMLMGKTPLAYRKTVRGKLFHLI